MVRSSAPATASTAAAHATSASGPVKARPLHASVSPVEVALRNAATAPDPRERAVAPAAIAPPTIITYAVHIAGGTAIGYPAPISHRRTIARSRPAGVGHAVTCIGAAPAILGPAVGPGRSGELVARC